MTDGKKSCFRSRGTWGRKFFVVNCGRSIGFGRINAGVPSDLAECVDGCSEFGRFWTGTPSDVAEAVIGCSEFERFWADMPSDSVEAEIGCRASVRKTFFMQSDFVETEKGCRASARQAFNMPSDPAEAVIGCRVCARQALNTPSDSAEAGSGWKVCRRKPPEAWQVQEAWPLHQRKSLPNSRIPASPPAKKTPPDAIKASGGIKYKDNRIICSGLCCG